MTAKVLRPCSIYGVPRQVGDTVEADETTVQNLTRKGVLIPVEAEAVTVENREEDLSKKTSKRSK